MAGSLAKVCNSFYVGLNMLIAIALLLLGVIFLEECQDMEIIVIYPIGKTGNFERNTLWRRTLRKAV